MSAKMIVKSNKLISIAELRRLTLGSFEAKIEEVRQSICRNLNKESFEILATKDNEAVICTGGKFYRASLTEGEPFLTELDVEAFSHSNVRSLIEREARLIADLYIRGSVKEAVAKLEKLVPMVPLFKGDKIVGTVEALLTAPRPWRRLFELRCDRIKDFLGEEVVVVENARLHPKFGKLYDGSIAEDELDSYDERVTEDLEVVIGRIAKVRDNIRAAFVAAGAYLFESAEQVISEYRLFADDLWRDLCSLHELSSHAMTVVDDTRDRGKLCDMLVNGLYDREVAGHFVVVAAKLVEAN